MRDMKESGIEWVGLIPVNWNTIANKYVMKKEKRICDKWNGEDVLSLTLNGVIVRDLVNPYGKMPATFDGYQYAYNGELLMCLFDIDVTPRCVGRVFNDGVTSPAYSCFKLNDGYDVGYYYYYYLMVDQTKELLHLAKNLRHSFTEEQLGVLKVPVPPIKEQRNIVEYLDSQCAEIDTLLDKTRKSIEEYIQLKQVVITQALTKGIRDNRNMKNSGIEWIGEIPEEWGIAKIKYGVTKVGSGKTPSGGAETYASEGILFLRSQNIYDTGLVLDNPVYITDEVDEDMKNTRVLPNDVLLNITGGSIGRCCIFPKEQGKANVNQHVSIIRVIDSIFLPEYMHYYWMSSLGKISISLLQTGGNREGMSANAIKNSLIPMIPIDEQREIIDYLDAKCIEMDNLISKKEQFLNELEVYKKSLIYECVTGKRKVV